jgi:hypothetical protein
MSTEPQQNLDDLFPLPKGVKLRTHKFGARPWSALVPAPVGGNLDASSTPRPEFQIPWEDQQQGLSVLVSEQENGRLVATVACTNACLLGKAVAVGLTGSAAEHPICKTISLHASETGGCGGAADFGPLTDAVKELGPHLGIVVFLLV